MATAPARRSHRGGIRSGETVSGWILSAPVLVALTLFLVFPILMTVWVSVSDYNGHGSPLSGNFNFVGGANYAAITSGGGLQEKLFGWSLRNTLWYVVLVVPTVTALSLLLAVLVNGKMLRARGFFRTAFYFPSVTSAVAITALWLFLFSGTGAVNKLLSWIGLHGPTWFNDPQGIITALLSVLGVKEGPPALVDHGFLGVSWWNWIGGPSWAMTALMLQAIFCTSGTFMLIFIAGLQNLPPEVEEAAVVDGATAWQRFWYVTLPQLKPTLFTVVTLGLIGAWQMFDQVFTSVKGAPGNTTYTLAYRAYSTSMIDGNWGQGSAVAFILFAIIIAFTILQRFWLRDKPDRPRRLKAAKG